MRTKFARSQKIITIALIRNVAFEFFRKYMVMLTGIAVAKVKMLATATIEKMGTAYWYSIFQSKVTSGAEASERRINTKPAVTVIQREFLIITATSRFVDLANVGASTRL